MTEVQNNIRKIYPGIKYRIQKMYNFDEITNRNIIIKNALPFYSLSNNSFRLASYSSLLIMMSS